MRNIFRKRINEIPLRPYSVQIHRGRISTSTIVEAASPKDAIRRLRRTLRTTDFVIGEASLLGFNRWYRRNKKARS